MKVVLKKKFFIKKAGDMVQEEEMILKEKGKLKDINRLFKLFVVKKKLIIIINKLLVLYAR